MSDSPLLEARNSIERFAPVKQALRRVAGVIHPNHITAIRVPGAVVAAALDRVSHTAGAVAYAVNTLLDWADGAVARSRKGSETREGTLLDPLVDKVSNAIVLAYQVAQHVDDWRFATAAAVSVTLNAVSQLQRGPIGGQVKDAARGVFAPGSCEPVETNGATKSIKANTWGKVKYMMESSAIGAMFAAGDSGMVRISAAATLAASSLLCIVGTVKRMRAGKSTEAPGEVQA